MMTIKLLETLDLHSCYCFRDKQVPFQTLHAWLPSAQPVYQCKLVSVGPLRLRITSSLCPPILMRTNHDPACCKREKLYFHRVGEFFNSSIKPTKVKQNVSTECVLH